MRYSPMGQPHVRRLLFAFLLANIVFPIAHEFPHVNRLLYTFIRTVAFIPFLYVALLNIFSDFLPHSIGTVQFPCYYK